MRMRMPGLHPFRPATPDLFGASSDARAGRLEAVVPATHDPTGTVTGSRRRAGVWLIHPATALIARLALASAFLVSGVHKALNFTDAVAEVRGLTGLEPAGLLAGVPGIAGTTMLGDGGVLIVLDLAELVA